MKADDGSRVIGRAPEDASAKARSRTYRSGFCGTGQCSRCPRAQGKCRCSCHDENDADVAETG